VEREVLLERDEAGRDVADLGLERADPLRDGGDLRGQRRLPRARFGQLGLRRGDPVLERLSRRRSGGEQDEDQAADKSSSHGTEFAGR
jgi:hypothetical protein